MSAQGASHHRSDRHARSPDVFACLSEPAKTGWAGWRAGLVDRIKRAALRRLHGSAGGERWLLRMYLIGEEATECALHEEWTQQPPAWLAPRIEQHLGDERRHAAAFARELQARGGAINARLAPDWLSRRKIAAWRRLGRRYAPHFAHGVLVSAYATGLCAEQMALRVLARHCAVIGRGHPMYPLLSRVLADEARHVRLCAQTLKRLVPADEAASLAALLAQVRAIEAGFGVTGAVAMWAVGWWHMLRAGRAARVAAT